MIRPILIVDDNADDVDILCHALRRAGICHPVQSFSSGEEAITHLTEISTADARADWQPLLCLLDVKMPGFQGAEVLQWIRGHDIFSSLPVIMCSSSDDQKDVQASAHFGAQCYARKYPTPEEFKEIIFCAARFTGDRNETFDVACNLLVAANHTRRTTSASESF